MIPSANNVKDYYRFKEKTADERRLDERRLDEITEKIIGGYIIRKKFYLLCMYNIYILEAVLIH